MDINSDQHIHSNLSLNEQSERNSFSDGLTIDNQTLRKIDLNSMPQSLDNQFEREFAHNVRDNASRQDPIEEKDLTINAHLCKDNKFAMRCNERNANDVVHSNETGFKFAVKFTNNNVAMLPFKKTRHSIQQVINEDMSTNDGLCPIHCLTGTGVKLHEARSINIFF